MTSKEAIQRIKDDFEIKYNNLKNEKDRQNIIGLCEVIEKDLEILEIIKRWSFIQDNYKEGYGKFTQFLCNIHTIGMKEDFEKVKGWLK